MDRLLVYQLAEHLIARLQRPQEAKALSDRFIAMLAAEPSENAATRLREQWAEIHHILLPLRIEMALKADLAPVVLRGEGELPWWVAEKTLAQKEEKHVFEPLRTPIGDSALIANGTHIADRYRSLIQNAQLTDCLSYPERTTAAAHGFLQASWDHAAEAQNVLERASQGPCRDAQEWERILDFPVPRDADHGDILKALTRPSMEAICSSTDLEIRRIKVPRSLAGAVFSPSPLVYRVGDCPSFRAERFLRCLFGRFYALAQGLLESNTSVTGSHQGATAMARALLFGALSEDVFRKTVDCSPTAARTTIQQLKSVLLLRNRAAAAILVHWEEIQEHPDALSDVMGGHFGFRLESLCAEWRLPTWPGTDFVEGAGSSIENTFLSHGLGAMIHLSVRDQFSETWFWNDTALQDPELVNAVHSVARTIEAPLERPDTSEISEDGPDTLVDSHESAQDGSASFLDWFSESF